MPPTDARTPTDPPGPRHSRSPRRPGRPGWLVLAVALGVAAGAGGATVHGGDHGFLASFCDALERTGSPSGAGGRCATAVADSR